MKRSTKSAPLALSTSYLIGSAFIGISMMTLNSSGALAPGVTFCRLMVALRGAGKPGFYAQDLHAPDGQFPMENTMPPTRDWPVACPEPRPASRLRLAGHFFTALDEKGYPLDHHIDGALLRAGLRLGRSRLRLRPTKLDPQPGCRQRAHARDRGGDSARRCRLTGAPVQDDRAGRRGTRDPDLRLH